MTTVIVFAIISFVLIFLAVRLYFAQKKNPSEYNYFFLRGVFAMGVGQIINILIILGYYFTGQAAWLYWSDYVARIFIYIAALFFIQMPLYYFFPKSKKRVWVSYILAGVGVVIFALAPLIYYQPTIDSNAIIHWNSPVIIDASTNLVPAIAWITVPIIFILDFIRSKFRSMRSLILGFGFVLASVAGIFQDYAQTKVEYILINGILLLGFIIVFIGLLTNEK